MHTRRGTRIEHLGRTQCALNGGDGRVSRFVLPDSDHRPAGATKLSVRLNVTTHVPLQLAVPVHLVSAWHPDVVWAPMPKATVEENRDFPPGKHHIRANESIARRDPHVLPEASSATMQRGPHSAFQRRVHGSVRPHGSRGRDTRCWRRWWHNARRGWVSLDLGGGIAG